MLSQDKQKLLSPEEIDAVVDYLELLYNIDNRNNPQNYENYRDTDITSEA
jgi:hypothetical protein